MIAHPKFTDIASGLNQIPVYLAYNDLYTFAREIQEYVSVQRIEGCLYNTKQISQLFLKYIDEPLYQQAKVLMQTRLESFQLGSVLISLQVPGLTTTITQQTLQLTDMKVPNGKHYDTVAKLSSLTYDTQSTNTDSFDHIIYDQVSADISSQKSKFKGVCAACGRSNHHAPE